MSFDVFIYFFSFYNMLYIRLKDKNNINFFFHNLYLMVSIFGQALN